jgi:hypothetical protein
MKRELRGITRSILLVLLVVGIGSASGAPAAEADNPKPVEVIGPVEIGSPVEITGPVQIGNLPYVEGHVTIGNFPESQRVVIEGVEGPPVPVVGGVFLIPDHSGQTSRVRVEGVDDEVPAYVVGGTVTVENLDDLLPPARVRGGQDVIQIPSGTPGLETFQVPADVTLTDLVVYSAGARGSCLVELCEQRSNGCYLFFSFEPDQGLNSINLNTGIDGHTVIRVGAQIGACGMSLLWSGFEN